MPMKIRGQRNKREDMENQELQNDYRKLYEAEREKNQKLIEQLKQLIETYGED